MDCGTVIDNNTLVLDRLCKNGNSVTKSTNVKKRCRAQLVHLFSMKVGMIVSCFMGNLQNLGLLWDFFLVERGLP